MASPREENKTPRQKSRQALSRNSTKLSLAVIDENALLSPDLTEGNTLHDNNAQSTNNPQRSNANNTKHARLKQQPSPTSTDIQEYESKDPREMLEERRQEVIQSYYKEVKARAKIFLKMRIKKKKQEEEEKAEAEKQQDEAQQQLNRASASDNDLRINLPTITEAIDEQALKKETSDHGAPDEETNYEIAMSSNTKLNTPEQNNATPTLGGIIPDISECNTNNSAQDNDIINENKSDEVSEMEKDAEDGIFVESDDSEESSEDDDDGHGGRRELSKKMKHAMHEAIWAGEKGLLDDLLDLPGGGINVLWYGENLLMTAIRADQKDIAAFLVDNSVNINHEMMRFEKRTDVQDEIEIKLAAALELEIEEQQKSKKKKRKTTKEKEKVALEELQKEVSEQHNNKSPEFQPPTALTDMDCFYISCRDLAVDLEKGEVLDLIDEKNGDQWPSKIKQREIQKKLPLRIKMAERDDWVYTESEDSEDEVEVTPVPEPVKPRRITAKNKNSSAQQKSSISPAKSNNHSENRRVSRAESQNTKAETSKLTASKEKLADSFTVAGATESEYWSPVPTEVPLELIHQPADIGPTKTKFPYRATRTFLTRKSANTKYYSNMEQNLNTKTRKIVTTRGSFNAESRLWTPSQSKFQNNGTRPNSNSVSKIEMTKNLEKSFNKVVDSFNDQLRYKQLRPAARQFTPWAEDDPVLVSNMMQRSKSNLTLTTKGNKPAPKKEILASSLDRYMALKSQSNNSIFASITQSSNNLQDWTSNISRRRPKTQGPDPTKSYGLPTSITSYIQNNRSHLKITNKPILLSSQKSIDGHLHQSPKKHAEIAKLYQALQSPLKTQNNRKKVSTAGSSRESIWAQRCTTPKSNSSKRYSPAGYLKGGHSREEMEQLNLISLDERNKETMSSPTVTVRS